MQEIIDKLEEWQDNIRYDIVSENQSETELAKMKIQSAELSMAIGLLSRLGPNNNIPK